MKRRLVMAVGVGCVLLFGVGLAELLRLRFEAGDVYPPYSSLRADPLGTMALYESLAEMPELTVKRDFSESRMPSGRGSVYLHLAGDARDWEALPDDVFKAAEDYIVEGGRLVVAFHPEPVARFRFMPNLKTVPGRPPGKGATNTPAVGPTNAPIYRPDVTRLVDRWSVGFHVIPLTRGTGESYDPVRVGSREPGLPAELEWHSGIVFTNLGPEWRAIYSRGRHPVLIERRWGRGSVVLSTDSYFASNEALRAGREAGLLSWLVSNARSVWFDEAHFGIVESPGLSGLVRNYRLEWLVAGLGLLVLLFLWQQGSALLPLRPAAAHDWHVTGRDSSAGFLNLLRRNLPPEQLIGTCFERWTGTLSQGSPHLIARVDRAQALVEAHQALPPGVRQPVRTYREIVQALQPGVDQNKTT